MKLRSFQAKASFPLPDGSGTNPVGGGLSADRAAKEIESVGPHGGRSGAEQCPGIQTNTPRQESNPATSAAAVPAAEPLSACGHAAQGDPASGSRDLPHETAGAEPFACEPSPETCEPSGRTGRPPEVVPTPAEARGLLSAYLKTNRSRDKGSMTTAARLFAQSPACSAELREAILREQGQPRASKHQLPRPVKRAMQASPALVTYSRNPRNADVMFGHARGVLRKHWAEARRLYAGERMSFDDGTINFCVCVPWPWGGCRCSEKFGVKVGRFQFLPANDDASDFIPGFTFTIRPTGAYRAADVCAAMGRIWRDTARPDWVVLERGTWEAARVSALCAAAGVGIGRSYAPRQKLIEGVFNRLWTVLSVMPGQVGRYRGEMERENKLLAAAQAGTLDPREAFVDLTVAMAALEEAVRFHNRTPVESKQYGKWVPETRWREDLAAHPRPALDAALAYLWAPEVRTWTVRRACVGGMVEQPLGMSLPSHWWAPELLDCEGRKVTAHFDPWEASAPATLTLADNWDVRGWKAGRVLATAVPCLEDLPAISRDAAASLAVHCGDDANERAKTMRATLRAIVLREYRALGADGTRARRESEVRAPEAVRPVEDISAPREISASRTPAAAPARAARPEPTDADLAALERAERRAQQRGLIPVGAGDEF